jgi:lipoprotein NlpI
VGAVRKAGETMQGSLYVRPEVFKAAAALPYKEALQQRLDAVLKATGRVLADAAITGQDAGGAWCERARVRAWLGMKADALKDAAKALQQNDQTAGLLCHGDVVLVTGNFKESAADYARAVALGSDDSRTWLSKSWADIYAGNKREALSDLARVLKASGDPQERLRAQIWQAMLGAPAIATAGTAADSASAGDAWLSAALEMFQSQQAPDQMLRLASRDGADGLEPRLAEAYFYAGKYYLQTQDKLRAKVYFQRAMDKGAVNNIHHHLARQELTLLP